MKTGRSLEQLASEVARQRDSKRDFLADTRKVDIAVQPTANDTNQVIARLTNGRGQQEQFPINTHALRQMEEHAGIPAKFADHLAAKHPDLLAHNLNELMHRKPSTQMVRTLDGNVRAFLSNSYRCLDNYEFAECVLQAVEGFGELVQIESCEVTTSRLYIKVVRPDLHARVGFNDKWQMGKDHNFFDEVVAAAVFSNSEVGDGGLWFRPGVWTKRCTNLAVFENNAVKKAHLGRKNDASEAGFWEVLSDRTKELSDAALWSQMRDLAKAALDGTMFQQEVAKLSAATQDVITADIAETMEVVQEKFGLVETERKGILDHLIRGGQMTRYGLHSAITRYSQDVESYDRASELERLGGRIIELAPKDWKALALAA